MEKNKSSVFRIDEKVFFTMGIVALIALLILAFRYNNSEPCEDVRITIKFPNNYVNTLISFKAETKNGKTYDWNFGDKSEPEYGKSSVLHAYTSPGRYTVTVIVDGKCEGVQTLDIKELPIVVNTDLQPRFTGPDSAYINKEVIFKDMTPDATSWEWRFGESSVVDATTREANHIYQSAGYKEVSLRLNGRADRVASKFVYVIDPKPKERVEKPVPVHRPRIMIMPHVPDKPITAPIGESEPVVAPGKPEIVKKSAPDIKVTEVIQFLEDVVNGSKDLTFFSKYFCDEPDIPVRFNDENMKFSQMCKKLKDFRKTNNITTPEVKIGKDKLNCIVFMDVTVEKRGFLKKLLKKDK